MLKIKLVLLIILLCVSNFFAQDAENLVLGKEYIGFLEDDEIKLYKIDLEANQFVRFELEQRGNFVMPFIYDSEDSFITYSLRPSDLVSTRWFSLVSDKKATFKIKVFGANLSRSNGVVVGRYVLRIKEIKPAAEAEFQQFEAEKLLATIPLNGFELEKKESYYQTARECIERFRKLGDKWNEALSYRLLGVLHFNYYERRKSLEYLQKASELFQSAGYEREYARTMQFLGSQASFLGEYDLANKSFEKALQFFEKQNDYGQIRPIITNKARISYELGDYQNAVKLLRDSIEIQKAPTIYQFRILGNSYFELGDYENALNYFQKLLKLPEATQKSAVSLVGESFRKIGLIYLYQKNPAASLEHFQKATELYAKNRDELGEANLLSAFGEYYFSQNDFQTALEKFRAALPLHLKTESLLGAANSRFWIAKSEARIGNYETAIEEISEAIKTIEAVRLNIYGDNLKNSFLAANAEYYQFYIEILSILHRREPNKKYDEKAFEISELARARTFLELLKHSSFNLKLDVSPELLSDEKDLQERLDEVALSARELKKEKNTEENRNNLKRLESELQKLTTELDFIRAKIRRLNKRYADLVEKPQPVSIGELQKNILDSETVLVEYKLGKEKSFVWFVSNKTFAIYELPKSEIIESKAKEVYSTITNRNNKQSATETDTKISELGKMILSPFEKDLQKKRIIVVADGALQYIPFASLKSGGKYLIENSVILNLPSATFLSELRKKEAGKTENKKLLAIVADPVFEKNDSRLPLSKKVSTDENSFPRLLFSRREADAIASIVPKNDLFLALDFNANKSTVINENLAKYRIVHFATHGIFDSQYPELSGLAFSMIDSKGNPQNGFLRLHEVYNLKLPADLIVLSGCQTGLGKEVRGEGLIGLTRGFMYAGASRVAASLWQIDDSATAELMKYFYTAMLKEKQTPAQALRTAQIQMLSQKRFQNPYFWAGFTIQGDWK